MVLKCIAWGVKQYVQFNSKVSKTRNNQIYIYAQCFYITLAKLLTCDKSMKVI